MRKYHDDNHANNRLARCYSMCKIDGSWVPRRIENATKESITVSCGAVFKMSDEDNIKFLFPRLGYVNTHHQCIYTTRTSRRLWKVGLVPDNFKLEPLFGRMMTFKDEVSGTDAVATLFYGKYPTARKALKEVLGGKAAARAFSRSFCFGLHAETKEVVLYYQNLPLGHYEKREDSVVIGDVNSHLVASFIEASKGEIEVLV